jgi:uncharacterized protein
MVERTAETTSSPIHDVLVEQHVKVPMRDGARLDATVWRPKAPGRYPVVVERVGYELTKRCTNLAEYYARRGYVFVGQNVRGTHASEGVPLAWNELWPSRGGETTHDGYDTIEWAADQPWSNGRIGMVDGSYSGATQYLVAPTRPPHLVALFAREACLDFHRLFFPGGAFQLSFWLLAIMVHVRNDHLAPRPAEPGVVEAHDRLGTAIADAATWKLHLPLKDCPPLRDLPHARLYFEALDHPEDGPYWWPGRLAPRYEEIDAPIFHFAGWFDLCLEPQIEYFQGIRDRGRSAACREGQRLLIGPWFHGPEHVGYRQAGELDFGPEAAFDLEAFRLRWYDHWLKGVENGVMDGPRVRVFLMGANRWLDLDDWPPPNVTPTPIYLRAGAGQSDASLNNGALTWSPPDAAEDSDRFAYDPAEPIPSLTDRPNVDYGPADFRPVEGRLLTYTSAPLERDLAIVGRVSAVLHGASSAPDTDWVVRLCDVYPDGRSMSVCAGILRVRYRDSLERPQLMAPGQIYQFAVDLGSTAQTFRAGHRLRVHVTSSDFPIYDRNLNTGGTFGEETVGRIAVNTVFHDPPRASHLLMPVFG